MVIYIDYIVKTKTIEQNKPSFYLYLADFANFLIQEKLLDR